MSQKPSSPSLSASPSDPRPADVMRIDRHRLRKARGKLDADEFQQLVERSAAQLQQRRAARPRIEYPSELPISSHRDELIETIRCRQAMVVCGETGSGKSTQLPKFCLEAGLGREAMIGHTQPRRLAARSIAARIAQELDAPLGKQVGCQVRFGDQTGPETLVKLMTDGILLAETQSDRFLDAYDAIIIDEAHERSLNIDFLLGYLRRLQGKRADLKIIITSATIDAERFAKHFADEDGPAPIVHVEGRNYPVDIQYLPWQSVAANESSGVDLSRHVIAGIEAASRCGAGDMLVFLPTERDIREVSHRVAGHYRRLGLHDRVDLLPLYARLPNSEQQKIFQSGGDKRRIIFATNVAESSLTVPNIRYVIDAGTARISHYSARSKLQRLPIEPISRASANQRSGRCGRIGPGVCVRLYSQQDYESRDEFTTPEIRRTNLASVVLQTKTLRLGKLEEFPLLDSPRPEAIREGVRALIEIGALDDRRELTEIGWKLGRMPVDPRVGRILLAADEHGVLPEALPIAAALEVQDPRDRPPDKQQAADEAHAVFADPHSDFLSYLRLWRYYEQARRDHSRSKLTRELRKRFLSPARMREWADVYRQLRETAATSGDSGGRKRKARAIGSIRYSEDPAQIVDDERYAAIHQSLLTGLLSGIANLSDKNEYTGAGGLKLWLWPGSGVFSSKPKWIVAAELVETTKRFARTVARIEPGWIERAGAHLVKRSHHDPHWSEKANGAFCYQNITLFGLTIVARRRVPLPPVDAATARDLLIDPGLVERKLHTNARFVRHNRMLQELIADLAARTRRRELVVDAYAVAGFYQERLPVEATDRGRLEKLDHAEPAPAWTQSLQGSDDLARWLQDPPGTDEPGGLYMRPEDLIGGAVDSIAGDDFPDELDLGGTRLPLEYRFEPGSDRDGVTVRVHQAALSQLSDDRLGWLVPGLLQPKLIAMIKSLPKRIRRNLAPAAETAARIAEELKQDYGQTPFMAAVCQAMSRRAEMQITPADFQRDKLDDHLDFLVTVVDDDGCKIAESRHLSGLTDACPPPADLAGAAGIDAGDEAWSVEAVKEFAFDELPREVIRTRGGIRVVQYPGLVDLGDAVSSQLFADQASAEAALRLGVMRLFAIAERKELRTQARWLPSLEQGKIKLAGVVSAGEVEDALIDLLARIAFVEGEPLVRTREAFEARSRERARRIAEATQQLEPWFDQLGDAYFAVRGELESMAQRDKFSAAVEDVRDQLSWLLPAKFLSQTPWSWLQHYPRYLKAIAYRLDKLRSGSQARDRESAETVRQLWARWIDGLSESERNPQRQSESEFRWMIEELRVSLFAQPLGTSRKVSPQRCEKLLA